MVATVFLISKSDRRIERYHMISTRIRIKNASKYNSQLKKPQKRSPNWAKIQTRAWHPREPFDTLGVPIRTNLWLGLRTLGLR